MTAGIRISGLRGGSAPAQPVPETVTVAGARFGKGNPVIEIEVDDAYTVGRADKRLRPEISGGEVVPIVGGRGHRG